MFDALWTLRLRWRLWLGTTGLLLLLGAGPVWWRQPPPTYQAEATVVVDGKAKAVLLGHLNSARLARQAGLRGGEAVRAEIPPHSDLVRVIGQAPTPDWEIWAPMAVLATLERQLAAETTRHRAEAEGGVTRTRRQLEQDLEQVTAALRRLPPPNGLPPVPAGGTLVLVGEGRRDVVRLALETRYLEVTKALAGLTLPVSGPSGGVTILDPAVTATAIPPPFAPLRAALIASLILGAMVAWVREWWSRELAQRKGGGDPHAA